MWTTLCTFIVVFCHVSTEYSIQNDGRGSWRVIYKDDANMTHVVATKISTCQVYASMCSIVLS